MHWFWDGHGVAMVIWWIVLLLVFVGIAWAVVRAIGVTSASAGAGRDLPPPSEPRGEGRDPEQILRDRYARGEIDDEEFERRLDRLRRS